MPPAPPPTPLPPGVLDDWTVKAEMDAALAPSKYPALQPLPAGKSTKVQTKLEGWIDQVFVDVTGKLVQKGQPLLTIYSPDMLASQRELLLAAKAKTIMRDSEYTIF